jgi:hypothetical protein
MEGDHDDRVHSGGSPTLTVHKYSPYLTVQEVQGTAMLSPIESNQGESQGSLPSSACPVWRVVSVSWSHVIVVTLATTI